MCILSGTPDFTPFGEFMISPIHYIYTIYLLNLSGLGQCVWLNDSGQFAWISLTALSCLLRDKSFSISIDILPNCVFLASGNDIGPVLIDVCLK